MSNELTERIEKTMVIWDEIMDAFHDIPFENSLYQTEKFVIAQCITPERAYRAIGLRLITKLQSLQEHEIARQLEEVDRDEHLATINNPDASEFDKRRARLKIQKIDTARPYMDKLVRDAMSDVTFCYEYFKRFPKYTAEQFEAGEERHFLERSFRQTAEMSGPIESLVNMNRDSIAMEKFLDAYALLPEEKKNEIGEFTERVLENLFNKQIDTPTDIRKQNILLKG